MLEENINPNKEITIINLEPYLSFANPPIKAPTNAVIFIETESVKSSLIWRRMQDKQAEILFTPSNSP